MLELEGEIKKWGNSAAVRMKRIELQKNHLRFNEKVRLIVIPKLSLKGRDLWGKLNIKKPTQEIMREIDKDLDVEF